MRNKVVKKLLMIAMAVTMISGTSIATVYANANPPAEETTTQVVEETATESTEDTEKKEDTGRVTGEGDNSAFSTPGNAQLVDDKENDDDSFLWGKVSVLYKKIKYRRRLLCLKK